MPLKSHIANDNIFTLQTLCEKSVEEVKVIDMNHPTPTCDICIKVSGMS